MLYRDLYYVGLSHSILLGQDCHFDIYGGTVSPRMFAALRHSPQKVAKDFLCAWVCITASLSHQHSDAQQRKWSARNQLRNLGSPSLSQDRWNLEPWTSHSAAFLWRSENLFDNLELFAPLLYQQQTMKSDHKKDASGHVALRKSDKRTKCRCFEFGDHKSRWLQIPRLVWPRERGWKHGWELSCHGYGGERAALLSVEVSLEMAETSEHGGAQAAAGDLRNGRMEIWGYVYLNLVCRVRDPWNIEITHLMPSRCIMNLDKVWQSRLMKPVGDVSIMFYVLLYVWSSKSRFW